VTRGEIAAPRTCCHGRPLPADGAANELVSGRALAPVRWERPYQVAVYGSAALTRMRAPTHDARPGRPPRAAALAPAATSADSVSFASSPASPWRTPPSRTSSARRYTRPRAPSPRATSLSRPTLFPRLRLSANGSYQLLLGSGTSTGQPETERRADQWILGARLAGAIGC